MPELRHDVAARGVDFLDHICPTSDRLPAINERRLRTTSCRGMINDRPLRDDQSDSVFGAAAILGRYIRSGDAFARPVASHRRHNDSVGESQPP